MTFEQFSEKAWNDHAVQPDAVAASLPAGLRFLERDDQIPALARLAAHVYGEHLGEWKRGVEFLQGLRALPVFAGAVETESTLASLILSLQLAAGEAPRLDSFSVSERIRARSAAAAALVGQKQTARAEEFLRFAVDESGELAKDDAANRALAVAGNNLAATLEERSALDADEQSLMVFAAQVARRFWEVAGTWLHVERAEYRLALSYLKAGDFAKALAHAQSCLEITRENEGGALEEFFGFEALARVEQARGNARGSAKAHAEAEARFAQLNDADRAWCAPIFAKLATH